MGNYRKETTICFFAKPNFPVKTKDGWQEKEKREVVWYENENKGHWDEFALVGENRIQNPKGISDQAVEAICEHTQNPPLNRDPKAIRLISPEELKIVFEKNQQFNDTT